ncbi:Zn-dependent hydrolase [Aquabacterium olei]|uniref:Zn-dependent hydrolase n=1 Tax=Aquabacterium olei TaxID=1296669 RepID=A0A2U8FQR6_9BURK|nr:MBL fold metallo-hydrolase [Aquabacterium olei]AWI53310.1 Zn-dependent hydrolase [Aquabacterium olei]
MNALASPLTYPWDRLTPDVGTLMTLRPGLHWVRMPMPFALNHINLWVLDDAGAWTVVDAGVATEAIRDAWQTLWAGPLASRPLGRMLVTHMHPDHVGNAQWLIERYSAPGEAARLWMSQADHLAARLACQSTTGFGGERAAAHFQAHGLNTPEDLAKVRARGDYYATLVPAVPHAYRRMMDGQTVRIGEREWRCIAGFGHSPEHIALHCEADGLLISGDMLLPTISTNVSVTDMEPEGDALGLFLDSVERMRALPADTLALPSHGLPFTGIHTRIDQLHAHHAERLAEVEAACRARPSTAAEMLPVLFRRQLDLHQTTFAMGEAIAHLNYLWHRGVLRREQDKHGAWRYGA